jgi:hypothetical protein
MKTRTLHAIVMAIVCLFTTHVADGQTSTNDLIVSAEARLLLDTNDTRVFLTIHLLNSSDHDATVLTKHLNIQTDGSTNQMSFNVGCGSTVTHDGHTIVPSLYDFSPVALKPNEEALISQEVALQPRSLMPETKFIVRYTISPEWAKRFALWSGSVESKSFGALIRKPQ